MLTKWKLSNFECFRDETEPKLGRLTLLAGPGNGGKSSIHLPEVVADPAPVDLYYPAGLSCCRLLHAVVLLSDHWLSCNSQLNQNEAAAF